MAIMPLLDRATRAACECAAHQVRPKPGAIPVWRYVAATDEARTPRPAEFGQKGLQNMKKLNVTYIAKIANLPERFRHRKVAGPVYWIEQGFIARNNAPQGSPSLTDLLRCWKRDITDDEKNELMEFWRCR